MPTAMAIDEERPRRLMSGPFPFSGGNHKYAPVKTAPTKR
jgi:hypothetical protein